MKQVGDLVATLNCETHVLLVSNVAHRAAAHGLAVETLCDTERLACDAILKEGLEWLHQRGVDATAHVVLGSPSEVIPRIARELGVDLVVVGHIPRTRFARWWAGPENVSLWTASTAAFWLLSGDSLLVCPVAMSASPA